MKNRNRTGRSDKNTVTKADEILSKLKNKPFLAVLLVGSILIIGVSNFFEAAQKIVDKHKLFFEDNLQIVNINVINNHQDFSRFLSTLKQANIDNWKNSWSSMIFNTPLIDVTFLNVGSDPSVLNSVELSLEQRAYTKRERSEGEMVMCMDIDGSYNVVIDPSLQNQKVNVRLSEGILTKALDRFIIILGSKIDIENIENRRTFFSFDRILSGLLSDKDSDLNGTSYKGNKPHYVKYHAEFDVVLRFSDNHGKVITSAPVRIEFNDNPCLSRMSKQPFAYFNSNVDRASAP